MPPAFFSPQRGRYATCMNDSTGAYLRPSQFGNMLGVQPRRTAYILGQLEALGFELPTDLNSARLVHPDLAVAVKAARAEKRDLATLRADPDLRHFVLASERNQDLDPLELLITAHAELAIVRSSVAALASGLRGIGSGDWQRYGWRSLGLLDPRGGL